VKRSNRWLLILAAAAVVLFLAGRLLFRPRPIEVEFARAEYGPVEDAVTNSEAGTVMSRASARLGAERAGRVAAIPFREGTFARRGAVLLALDRSTAATHLEAARRDLEAVTALHRAARAAATLARSSFERTERLGKDDLVSQAQLDEVRSRRDGAEADLHAAEARVASGRAAVRLAEDELAHLEVRAPFDGVVTRRLVEIGESVVPGQPVLELVDPDRLYVSAPIDERDAGRLEKGLPARVTLDTYPGVTWRGRIARVAPMVETAKEQNRTLEVEVELPVERGQPRPRPGMTADVEVVLERRERVLRIPSFALLEGRRVLVVERGRAIARDVQTALRNWEWTEVRSGVKEGESVVTSLDRSGLKDGVAVTAKPWTPEKRSRGGGAPPDSAPAAP
jgi:HlyD family secretion protein